MFRDQFPRFWKLFFIPLNQFQVSRILVLYKVFKAMAEWQPYLQSIILGFIFSFLLAKLFSVIFSFREDNLRISRSTSSEDVLNSSHSEPTEAAEHLDGSIDEFSRVSEKEPLIAQENISYDTSDSDDDWEGVESTELDKAFSAATAFVIATAADRSSQKVSSDVQLQLYALYKIATEGPCSAPQPSALKMTARAKWHAWQKLGVMPPEEAMLKYIEIVTEIYPSWAAGSTLKRSGGDGSDTSIDSKGPMGPVFSTYVYEEESGNELQMEAIHAFAREGEVENLLKCIESGVSVDLKDSEGRTPLHWAVDRGHHKITEVLLSKNAYVNSKDNDGQTPLHYAAVCERESIAKLLVEQNADVNIKDDDGNYPRDLCELNWSWMQCVVTD